MKVAIIGTAGRGTSFQNLNIEVFLKMLADTEKKLKNLGKKLILVSGGAAWADHLAVDLYLRNIYKNLILYLPAAFEKEQFIDNGFKSPGNTANYYHKKFSEKVGRNTLKEIALTKEKGAQHFIFNGFHARNLEVAKSDILLAYTFGSGQEPADGGTLHTWKNSTASIKIHQPIQLL